MLVRAEKEDWIEKRVHRKSRDQVDRESGDESGRQKMETISSWVSFVASNCSLADIARMFIQCNKTISKLTWPQT